MQRKRRSIRIQYEIICARCWVRDHFNLEWAIVGMKVLNGEGDGRWIFAVDSAHRRTHTSDVRADRYTVPTLGAQLIGSVWIDFSRGNKPQGVFFVRHEDHRSNGYWLIVLHGDLALNRDVSELRATPCQRKQDSQATGGDGEMTNDES